MDWHGTAVVVASMMLAHSWYPHNCCGDGHCHPVPCGEITRSANGDVTWHGMTISKYGFYPSQDGHCHACDYLGRVLYCVFEPQPTS